MIKKFDFPKRIPLLIAIGIIAFVSYAIIRGSVLVNKSEKELVPQKHTEEAEAGKYRLKEIDAKTGDVRWELIAEEGKTEDNLQAATIKNIKASVYKNMVAVFNLYAPSGKANAATKEIFLYGDVIASDANKDFLLHSNQIALGMGTSIEAQKGFNLVLRNTGTIIGESALINDDQSKISVENLKEAAFKDVLISGESVYIEKNKKGDLTKAIISKNGKVVLKNKNNDVLNANKIIWEREKDIEATGNVIYTSQDKIFKAGYLLLKPDNKFYAKNNVVILHGSTQCFGDSLSYENNSLITITGNPKAIQESKQILADKIIYNLDTNKLEALGNVRTIVKNNKESHQ